MTESSTNARNSALAQASDADVAAFVGENPLFYNLSTPVIASIAEKLFTKQYGPDDLIIREGEHGDSFYIIRQGHVHAVTFRDGQELVLSEMGPGEGFGEMALITDQPRSATIKALDNVEVLVLMRHDFNVLYRELPELAMEMDRLKRQRVSLLESEESSLQTDKFTSNRRIELDYAYLDLLMKLNEASGGDEQVEHCKETGQLAREMSKILCPMVAEELLFAGYLHEIGKISLPRDLVLRERHGEQLTPDEEERFSKIFAQAVDILSPNKNLYNSLRFMSYLGLKNYHEMPLEAQILKVANDFLEYRSSHYKNLSDDVTLEKMRAGTGTLYNPKIITALEKNIGKYKDIRVEAQLNVVRMMVIALDRKDNYTWRHSMDVRNVGLALASRLGLGRKEREFIRLGAELHDAGKIFIDERILNAPRRLTDEEFAIMKQHAKRSADFFADIFGMDELAAIVGAHHEKYDGTGYPNGLKGEEIPFIARIMVIADVWSALTTPRVYRVDANGKPKAHPPEKALAIMDDMANGHFDPHLYPLFREYVQEVIIPGKQELPSEFSDAPPS